MMMNRRAWWISIVFCLIILSCGGGGGDRGGGGSSEANTSPEAPQSVVSTGGNGQVSLSWGNVSGATEYHIYWSTTAGVNKQNGTKISNVSSIYYHNGLTNGTTYYYVVTAANQYGESADSATVSAVITNDLQDVCVALGDSFTTGYGIAYAETYVPRLSAIWGKTVYNKGISTADGPPSSYGAAVIDGILAQYNPKYITIFFGCNDVSYSIDWTIGNFRYMIRSAKVHGTKPVIATLTPFFGQYASRKPYVIALNQRIRQLASEEGINCADLEAAFGWDPAYIQSDGAHPNSAGHAVIANTFYGALTR
jgi:lysophospholipase L1-like esterase